MSFNYRRLEYFLLKFCTHLPLTKGCSGFFLFWLDLELFAKITGNLVSTHSHKPGFLLFHNKSRSKLNKKNPKHAFVDIVKYETRAKFLGKILNSMVVGAQQSFKSFRQITWFLGNSRALSNFSLLNLYYHIIKKSVCKSQFLFNHASNLNKYN